MIKKFERFDNICGGIQYAFEEIVSKWVYNYVLKYNVKYIALAGGAFMNVKANLKILQLPKIENLFVTLCFSFSRIDRQQKNEHIICRLCMEYVSDGGMELST